MRQKFNIMPLYVVARRKVVFECFISVRHGTVGVGSCVSTMANKKSARYKFYIWTRFNKIHISKQWTPMLELIRMHCERWSRTSTFSTMMILSIVASQLLFFIVGILLVYWLCDQNTRAKQKHKTIERNLHTHTHAENVPFLVLNARKIQQKEAITKHYSGTKSTNDCIATQLS